MLESKVRLQQVFIKMQMSDYLSMILWGQISQESACNPRNPKKYLGY